MSSTASNGAARQSPDEHLHSACRGGGWIKIKSCRRANARPVEWGRAWVYSVLHLLFCGSWLASEGGLTADPISRMYPALCGRWPASEGGLTADPISRLHSVPCGSWSASEGGLTADPISRLYSVTCGSWPASEGGLTADPISRLYSIPCGSKPAPTDLRCLMMFWATQISRSRLAGDCGG